MDETLLQEVKLSARVSNDHFDTDIKELIESARMELIQAGVSPDVAKSNKDTLIIRAIKIYVKANFGIDSPNAERFQRSFDLLKQHLSMAGDYNERAME